MGPGRGPLSGCSGSFLATVGVTCLVLGVLLPGLDALQDKGEVETLYLDGPGTCLVPQSALIWTPAQISGQHRGVFTT